MTPATPSCELETDGAGSVFSLQTLSRPSLRVRPRVDEALLVASLDRLLTGRDTERSLVLGRRTADR
jgi:hypothetical protein